MTASSRPLDEAFVADLNRILRRPDLYDQTAWAGVPLPDEAQRMLANRGRLGGADLSRLNLLLVAAAFPELSAPPKPPRNLLGYLSQATIPGMLPRLQEMATGEMPNQHLTEAWSFLRPDIEAVREMEATGSLPPEWEELPEAERIYQHEKRRLSQRYGPALEWWNAQIRACQPQNPFPVKDRGALQCAKELLKRNGVSEQLWEAPGARYHVPTKALHPYGAKVIERMLAGGNPARPVALPEPALVAVGPAPAQDVDMAWLRDESPAQVYERLVERLFHPHSAEHEVGRFIARNPNCTRQQAQQFVNSLAEDVGDDIRSIGWERLVTEVDTKVLDALRDPDARAKMTQDMGVVCAAADRVRRSIYARTARLFWLRAG
jgi:hypothetical protein